MPAAAETQSALENPLSKPWSGPYGGVPDFNAVQLEHFEPALLAAMDEYRGEIVSIASQPDPPSFGNTIEALENAGRALHRVGAVYNIWDGSLATPEFQAVARNMAPRLAAIRDEVVQNATLFARVKSVFEAPGDELSAEQKRLVWRAHQDFVLAGAELGEAQKAELSRINQRLASLFTTFNQNVLHDEEHYSLVLESEADLAGLPQPVRDAAAAAARAQGHDGKWAIVNTRSSVEPFLSFSSRRDLRKRVFESFVSRGDNGDEHDNDAIVTEILKLRAERAQLLGYPSHAHWALQDTMAKTPEATLELMLAVWEPALERVAEEVRDMQAIADREPEHPTIEPWDYRYYAEKVRKAKYDLDENELTPYLQLDKLREGLFFVAKQLFDLDFSPAPDVPVFHPDVKVWKVERAGKLVGLWYFDPYARAGKRSGAWMDAYRDQESFRGEVVTLVSNNSNFVKPSGSEPTLISWEDAETMFHEFGHALHGLCSQVGYPSLSGTNVARDFVEFPSQLLEHWLMTPEVLGRFALHHETGEPLPKELVERLERARHFNQGFATVEYLSTALVDMKLHLISDRTIEPAKFEREALAELKMPKQIVMRHRIPHLSHLFSGDSYSAGYYSYLWADTLTADAFEAFEEAGGPYDPQVAQRLYERVFSVGNTIDPAEAYESFRGRQPGIGALMRKRGFPVPKQAKSSG